jgi:Apea-like HEPN
MTSEEKNIFDSIEGLVDEYAELLLKALEDGLSAIKEACKKGDYIGSYYDFPSVSYGKNGLPGFSTSMGSGPVDYRNCFHSYGGKPKVDEKDIASFTDLIEFVRKHPKLHRRFTIDYVPPVDSEIDIKVDEINIVSGIKDSIDRYIHSNASYEYEKEKGVSAITPTIAYIFSKNLDIEICVPILFLQFPFDEYKISDSVYISRITDKQHQARYGVESYNTSAHKSVKSSATHAFMLKGWHVPNADRMWYFDVLSKPRAYPLQIINNFFGALRIAITANTGYAQIYSIANGWAVHNKSDLPYAQGATVRSYPGWFEDYYWNIETVPSVSNEEMEQISMLYNNIASATENSIHLSVKRLNQCLVRDNEEDSVLDATIALEALLSDDGNQEMTHKLAMRIGALSRLDKSFNRTPFESFGDVKKIYAYRSAIVHGSKGLDKKKAIKIDEENEVNAHVLAVEYLRMILRVVLSHPDYRAPRNIDEKLLLNCEIGNT